MAKMFVHYSGTIDAFKLAGLESTYENHIVFIKGGTDGTGAAVYTHYNYYGDVKDAVAALESNHTILQTQVNNLKYFSKISDGNTFASTAEANGTITITGEDPAVTTRIDTTGIKVGLSQDFKDEVLVNLPADIQTVSDKLGEKGAAAASGTEATAFGRIKNLETIVAGLTGTEGGEVESVDSKISTAINALDVEVSTGDYVHTIKQVDGKIVATTGTFNFDEAGAAETVKTTVIGASTDASSADTIYGAKKYAEEKASAAQTAAINTAASDATTKADAALASAKTYVGEEIATLDADVTSAEPDHKVRVQVVEVDGKITAVNVTESDIASAATLAEVKADVDAFFNDALSDGAEQVKDTLREIQDYITSDTEAAATMTASITAAKNAADAAQEAADNAQGEVDALELVVEGVKNTANAAATKTALETEISRAKAAEEANANAIDAIEADYLTASDKTDLTNLIDGKVSSTTYATDKTTLENADANNLNTAKEYAEGLIAALDVNDDAVTGKYVSAVSEADGKISVTREALPTYTLATGSANGTVALNGNDASVKGLGSAAYTDASAYATAAQGTKADAAAPQATTYTKDEIDAMWTWEEL